MSIHVVLNDPLPPSEDIPANIAEALISLQEFLGIPFPQDFVVALMPVVGPAAEVEVYYSNLNAGWNVGGAYGGGHFLVLRAGNVPVNRSVLYHEPAHYYFNFAHPAWLLEGGASFMSVYADDRLGLQPLESRLTGLSNRIEAGCLSEEVRNIFDLGEPGCTLQADGRTRCFYLMGERFFIEFSLSLGPDTSAGALRGLLQSIYFPERSVPLETRDVVLAWWSNASPDRPGGFPSTFQRGLTSDRPLNSIISNSAPG